MALRPKDRLAILYRNTERELAASKEKDYNWEDFVDVSYTSLFSYATISSSYLLQYPYQATPASFSSRLFKFMPPPEAPSWPRATSPMNLDEQKPGSTAPVPQRAVRLRYGRGGRLMVDRRLSTTPSIVSSRKQPTAETLSSDMDVEDEETERHRRLAERWRFDSDDAPAVGPTSDEQDRVLIDDFDPK